MRKLSPEAIESLREAGRKGSAARSRKLTPARRREIAVIAAAARWANYRKTQEDVNG